MKTSLSTRVGAVVAAGLLVASGASAFAATADLQDSKVAAAAEKCKKKNKKKCPKPVEEGFVPGRVVELTYEGPAIGGADTPAINIFGALAPVNFIPGPGETQALIEIVDNYSPKASAGFSYDSDGDGLNDTGIDVCGETPEPVEMLEGTQYNVFPYLLPSTSCTDGVATSGKIIVTFNKV